MSKRSPRIGKTSGETEADFSYLDTDEEKHQFNTRLRASLLEKVKAGAFHEDASITDFVNELIAEGIKARESERGSEYEVYPPHRVA